MSTSFPKGYGPLPKFTSDQQPQTASKGRLDNESQKAGREKINIGGHRAEQISPKGNKVNDTIISQQEVNRGVFGQTVEEKPSTLQERRISSSIESTDVAGIRQSSMYRGSAVSHYDSLPFFPATPPPYSEIAKPPPYSEIAKPPPYSSKIEGAEEKFALEQQNKENSGTSKGKQGFQDAVDTVVKKNKVQSIESQQLSPEIKLGKIKQGPMNREITHKNEVQVSDASSSNTKYGSAIREDRELMTNFSINIGGKEIKAKLFGVFDGHADYGKIASHVAKNLSGRLQENIKNSAKKENSTELTDTIIKEALTTTFVGFQKELESERKLKLEGKKSELGGCAQLGGTTATAALVVGKNVYFPNVGDSRTIVVRKGGTVEQLTLDAKPDDKRFKSEIEEGGGKVVDGRVVSGKEERQSSKLAVARDIGSLGLHGAVRADPIITKTEISEGDTIVLASDGLYDVSTTKDVGAVVGALREKGENSKYISQMLVAGAVENDTRDDVTVVVVNF